MRRSRRVSFVPSFHEGFPRIRVLDIRKLSALHLMVVEAVFLNEEQSPHLRPTYAAVGMPALLDAYFPIQPSKY